MKSTLVLFLIFLFCSCHEQNSDLEIALALSGTNRTELEQVLKHYSRNSFDSLKLKAAEFLIVNMPGHFSYYGSSLDAYKDSVDASAMMRSLPWSIRNIFYLYPYQDVYSLKNVKRLEDVKCITASYLISNIEHAFKCWKYPWARHLSFDGFCEYLLPYRIGNEPLTSWRDSLQGVYDNVLEGMQGVDELFESPYQACLQVNDKLIAQMGKARADSICFAHPLVGIKKVVDMKCLEYIPTAVLVMRSLGIPVSMEMIEQWSSRRGRHYWNAVYHFTGIRYPFTGFDSRPRGLNQDYKMNKVYRRTYAINEQTLICQNLDEPIPSFFEDRFLKDVTNEYMTCHNITVYLDFPPVEKREYAYLCVFNNESWTPVHFGKIKDEKVIFTNVGSQTMFIAGYYINDKIVPASLPFHVDLNGNIKYISVSSQESMSLKISRKAPLLHRFANYSRHLNGATIEASDYSDFRKVDTLGVIRHDANTQYDSIYTNKCVPHRYLRIKHATNVLQLSELETFDSDTTRCLYGKLFLPNSNSTARVYDLYNKIITDYIEVTGWIGVDFMQPICLKKVKYLPRTDSNHIMAGDIYELFLYKNYSFQSLEKLRAESSTIKFERVPVDGLYLVKDKTQGTEHRIFTIEKGQIYFFHLVISSRNI